MRPLGQKSRHFLVCGYVKSIGTESQAVIGAARRLSYALPKSSLRAQINVVSEERLDLKRPQNHSVERVTNVGGASNERIATPSMRVQK